MYSIFSPEYGFDFEFCSLSLLGKTEQILWYRKCIILDSADLQGNWKVSFAGLLAEAGASRKQPDPLLSSEVHLGPLRQSQSQERFPSSRQPQPTLESVLGACVSVCRRGDTPSAPQTEVCSHTFPTLGPRTPVQPRPVPLASSPPYSEDRLMTLCLLLEEAGPGRRSEANPLPLAHTHFPSQI